MSSLCHQTSSSATPSTAPACATTETSAAKTTDDNQHLLAGGTASLSQQAASGLWGNSMALSAMSSFSVAGAEEDEGSLWGAMAGMAAQMGLSFEEGSAAVTAGAQSGPGTSLQVGLEAGTLSGRLTEKAPVVAAEGGEGVEPMAQTSVGLTVGEGVGLSVAHQQVDAAGRTQGASLGGGVVARADGETGVQGSASVTSSLPGSDTVLTTQAQNVVTNRGAERSLTRSLDDGKGSTRSLTTQGAVKAYAQRQGDGTWLLTCTVSMGGGLGAGRENKADAKNPGVVDATSSGKVSASAGATLSFQHVLTEAELAQYEADVQRAEAGEVVKGGAPELGLIASLSLASGQDAGALQALTSPSAAASLAEGDALSLQTQAGGTLGVSGAAGPLKADLGAGQTFQRTLQVKRVVDPQTLLSQVEITVCFLDTRQNNAGLTATPSGVVSGGGAVRQSASEGASHSFRLDPAAPDYAAQFDAIRGAWSPGALAEVAARIPAHSSSRSHATTDATEATLGVAGAAVSLSRQSRCSEAITEDEAGRLAGQVEGAESLQATVSVLGAVVADEGREDALSGSLGAGAGQVDLLTTEQIQQLKDAAAVGAIPSTGWLAQLWAAIRQPKGKVIAGALAEVRQAVSMLRLGDADLQQIWGRAGDRVGWESAMSGLSSVAAFAPWMGLRRALVAPLAAPDYPDAAMEERLLLSRLRSLASFVAQTGQDGVALLTGVARDWQGGGSNADLGEQAMFPPALAGEKDAYWHFRDGVDAGLDENHRPKTLSAGDLDALAREGGRLTVSISACTAFSSARVKMEMLDALSQRLDRLRLARLHLAHDGETLCVDAASTDPALAARQSEVARLEGLLGGCKAEERRLLSPLGATPTSPQETAFLGQSLDQVSDLYDHWVGQILRLRAAYDALDEQICVGTQTVTREMLPPRQVSAPGGARNPALEPEAQRYFEGLIAFRGVGMSHGLSAKDRERQQWLGRY